MKKILKFTALSVVLLVLAGLMTSCDEKQSECTPIAVHIETCFELLENFEPDGSASIIGKWKLKKGLEFFGGCLDYSQCNIVYEFRPDGTLIISGRSLHPEHRAGSNTFSVTIDETGMPLVRINNFERAFTFSRDILPMGFNVALDGPMYIFVRIVPNIN